MRYIFLHIELNFKHKDMREWWCASGKIAKTGKSEYFALALYFRQGDKVHIMKGGLNENWDIQSERCCQSHGSLGY